MELDFKTVKALSSPTRVKILRQVLEKESTPTQLSRDLDRSKSTVSTHLSKLHRSGLVDKDEEEGRKRVVYSATEKAEAIVSGKERKVKFSIASSAFSMIAGTASIGYFWRETMYSTSQSSPKLSADQMGTMGQESMNTMQDPSMLASLSPDILLYIGIGLLGISLAGFLYGITLNKLTE